MDRKINRQACSIILRAGPISLSAAYLPLFWTSDSKGPDVSVGSAQHGSERGPLHSAVPMIPIVIGIIGMAPKNQCTISQ